MRTLQPERAGHVRVRARAAVDGPTVEIDVDPAFAPTILTTDMAAHWEGIEHEGRRRDVPGTSHLVLPAPGPGRARSAHFDPASPSYQAFFGVYVLPPWEGRPVPPALFDALGNRDNLGWLARMGDPAPRSTTLGPSRTAVVAGGSRVRFSRRCRTHADLGGANPTSGLPALVLPDGSEDERAVPPPYHDVTWLLEALAWHEREHLVIAWWSRIAPEDLPGPTRWQAALDLRAAQEAMAWSVRVTGWRSAPGRVDAPSTERERCATDFGGFLRRIPAQVCDPLDESQAQASLDRAAQTQVAVRGAGHSCGGQALTRGGLVISSFREDAEVTWLGDDLVEVSARSRWREVERALNARGRACPVLTDYLDLSVGGTLSVGGIGLGSVAHGCQVDRVERLRLLRPGREPIWCSRDEHGEPFRFALAGLGQMGLIERVVLRTEPDRPVAHTLIREHRSTADLVGLLEDVAAHPGALDHFQAFRRGGRYTSEYGRLIAGVDEMPTYPAPLRRGVVREALVREQAFVLHERRVRWLFGYPRHLRLWTDYVFPDTRGLSTFLAELDGLSATAPLAETLGAVYILAIARPSHATAFALLPARPGTLSFGVGLYVMVDRYRPDLLVATRSTLAEALRRAVDLGARPYLYGVNDLDADLLRRLYGEDAERLVTLRRTLGLERVNAGAFPLPEEKKGGSHG